MCLGTGAPHTAGVVVTTHGNGPGDGDLTLPHAAVAGHTTSGLDDEVLIGGRRPRHARGSRRPTSPTGWGSIAVPTRFALARPPSRPCAPANDCQFSRKESNG